MGASNSRDRSQRCVWELIDRALRRLAGQSRTIFVPRGGALTVLVGSGRGAIRGGTDVLAATLGTHRGASVVGKKEKCAVVAAPQGPTGPLAASRAGDRERLRCLYADFAGEAAFICYAAHENRILGRSFAERRAEEQVSDAGNHQQRRPAQRNEHPSAPHAACIRTNGDFLRARERWSVVRQTDILPHVGDCLEQEGQLAAADSRLAAAHSLQAASVIISTVNPMEFRTGIGYDLHRTGAPRPLVLGGLTIPHDTGLIGHSDADVVLHAVVDALLGAAGIGDIGDLFPDTDARYRDMDSHRFIEEALRRIRAGGFEPVNCDVIVHAERPKLGPHKGAIRDHLAQVMGLATDCVCVKATTNEKLGEIGRGEAIACWATVLLRRTIAGQYESRPDPSACGGES